MSQTVAATHKPRPARPRVLIVAGALITVATAVVAVLWLQRLPEVQPVAFGQQVQISATDSTSATIFASTGLTQAPSCQVTTDNGRPVTVGEEGRYLQEGGLESIFGFPIASGTTYNITCTATEPGQFAVAQDLAVPWGGFIAAGSLGLVTCGLGAALAARQRRARTTGSHSTN